MLVSDGGFDDPLTYAIIGAAMEVHRALGCGFLEAVYSEALEIELRLRGLPYLREHEFPIVYKGRRLGCTYRVDFLCYGDIVVELKALSTLTPLEDAQVLNYLRASGLRRGLLLNFGSKRLQKRRLVLSDDPE